MATTLPTEVVLDGLKAAAGGRLATLDPVNDIEPVARYVERHASIPSFTVSDVHDALLELEKQGLVRHVVYGRGDGWAMTEAGLER